MVPIFQRIRIHESILMEMGMYFNIEKPFFLFFRRLPGLGCHGFLKTPSLFFTL
jgi:hypothetical protein